MSDNQTKLGVAPNVGGLICYVPCCVGLVFSIAVAIVEKENKFIRFHAFQSLLLHGVEFILSFGLQAGAAVVGIASSTLGALVSLLSLPIAVALLGLQIFLMIKANNNEEFKLPVIGDLATTWA